MRKTLHATLYVLGCWLFLIATPSPAEPAAANAAPPRAQVDAVAQVIEANYYDAAKGKRVADDLRAQAGQGRYDAFTDPRDLANALTERLQPLDGHFSVRWSDKAPPPPTRGPAKKGLRIISPDQERLSRRANYGIRRVEVWPGNVGYLDLREFAHIEFGRSSPSPARQAIDAALHMLSGTDAIVIDLRYNGGGSPAMVGYLSSAFTPKGADIYNTFHSREGTQSEAPDDTYPTPRLDVPLYLLTSGRTASAGEAFAYTLKNAKRAVVVGDRSAGAANPGGLFPAGQGLEVFVSTGSPISPITHRNWEHEGVMPDVAVDPEQALSAARALAQEAVVKRGLPEPDATDARWVLEALRAPATQPASATFDEYLGQYGPFKVTNQQGRFCLLRDRRPPVFLQWLSKDLFAAIDQPNQRLRFERNAQGDVVALEWMMPQDSLRVRRDAGSETRASQTKAAASVRP